MQRRKFFKDIGLGIGSGLVAPNLLAYAPPIAKEGYFGIRSLSDATNENGELALRLAFSNDGMKIDSSKVRIKISGNSILGRKKWYFLESPQQVAPNFSVNPEELHPGDMDVLVIWINTATEATEITVYFAKNSLRFTLGELLENGQLGTKGPVSFTVNFLGYTEVGKLAPSSLNIKNTETFRFAIMADPQGGDAFKPFSGAPTRIKIHNAFIEDTVQRINELEPKPKFTLILGDFVDDQGEAGHFAKMESLIAPLKMPVLLGVGNHESPYNADFTPAYNMKDLDNFFDSQKRVNGMEKILYSFDLGQWHFIVWPDPLRKNFWATHPHYFDWLDSDLKANKERPVIFMQHVPIHPIGIDPLTTYVESATVKRTLIDILAKHGNVEYVFSGHVHIPLKASLKTAVSYKGMRFINLPAAGFRPRAFGEEDFFGGPEQGVCILDIKGNEVDVRFQHVTKEWFTYPKDFPELDAGKYALWFNEPWELPLQPSITNGNFASKLDYWHQRFVYHEDNNPSNIRETQKTPDGHTALYLYTRKRGYDVPGQDRMPQHINRVFQAISIKDLATPTLRLTYQLNKGHYDPKSLNGFFLWLECYKGPYNVANFIYSPGKVYGSLTNAFGQKRPAPDLHFNLPSETGFWYDLVLPLAKDFDKAGKTGKQFKHLDADRMVIHLGTWTVNVGIGQEAGVFIKEISLSPNEEGKTTPQKNDSDIWRLKIDHIAGDHQYTEQAMVYPSGLQGKGEHFNGYSNGKE